MASAPRRRTVSNRWFLTALAASAAAALLTTAAWWLKTGDLAPWWATNTAGLTVGLAALLSREQRP